MPSNKSEAKAPDKQKIIATNTYISANKIEINICLRLLPVFTLVKFALTRIASRKSQPRRSAPVKSAPARSFRPRKDLFLVTVQGVNEN